jgi:hypothetical protein
VKFSQFVDVVTAALYNEAQLAGKSEFRLGEILDRYGLSLDPRWGERLFDDYTFSSRIDSRRHIGPLVQQHVSLSPTGLRWAEDELGENVASFLERNGAHYTVPDNVLTNEDGEPITTEDGEYITVEDAIDSVPSPTEIRVQSEAWTGISSVRIDARNAQAVSRLIDAALNELPRDGNERVAQARTLLLAAKELTDAPEPPSDIIWELVQRAGAVVGLLDIFIRIFVGLTH